MSVIEYAKDSSASAASRFFNIHRSMVSRWMKQEIDLQHAHPRQRRLGTPGRRVSYPESENIVYHDETSMANSTIMCQWLKIIFGEIDTTRDSLLVLVSVHVY